MEQEVLLKLAPPYDDRQIDALRLGFEELLGHPVELRIEEDASLIGGFVAFADGKVYDASMRTKLGSLRSALMEE